MNITTLHSELFLVEKRKQILNVSKEIAAVKCSTKHKILNHYHIQCEALE